ncbi:MAG: cytochrome c-type biogenesis protein CcmH [Acidimicrobiia bacterium]|nr:cytochrome c-type biogenesis protein CcmH [Acidimicrobiia bacterium]NNF68563.1 cytochrome c-type biogenesis protein CcmH [Acidimicrobiia bacterium]NNK91248.1 cytochrome c-type biogenesis protein CcmH [Acidimicrobiia bacterium]
MAGDIRRTATWAITGVLAIVILVGFVQGDPEPEDRVARLGSAIKCPVCQGEAIIDSPSPTAEAMMDVLEEKVAAGETDGQIVDYFTARFGDGIYLDPPFAGRTLLVWLIPMAAVVGGFWMILSRRRVAVDEPAEAEPS